MLSRTSLCLNQQILSKRNIITQIMIGRSMHVTCRLKSNLFKCCPSKRIISRSNPFLASTFVRCINTENVSEAIESPPAIPTKNLIDSIPDVPIPVPEVVELLKEPSFASLGLCNYTPVGLVEKCMEFLHITCDLPWWGAIAAATMAMRIMIFPLVIISQRNSAQMQNVMPGLQKIQQELTEARTTGDHIEAARLTQEMMIYMRDNKCSPVKNMIVPLAQAPIFISFFFGLKSMANLPVQSMQTGGLFWFTDLTIPDPYYLLSILTSISMGAIFKFGIDGPKLEQFGVAKYFIGALPVILLPFTLNFPAAITYYWVTTNVISVIQVMMLKIPKFRAFLKIPTEIKHAPNTLAKKKNFKEGLKDSWSNMKLAREMVDRQQLDVVQFNKAGRGPIQKTYSYNPLEDALKKKSMNKK